MTSLAEQLARAKAQAEHCLNGGARQPHQGGSDINWLMGYGDNAVEVELIQEKMDLFACATDPAK